VRSTRKLYGTLIATAPMNPFTNVEEPGNGWS
jgi:hypothetical protein